jgi:AbiTii-like protein
MGAEIPDYREIRGVAKAFNPLRGWLKIEFGDNHDLEDRLSTQKSRQPLSEIEEMANRDSGILTFIAPSALVGRIENASDPRIFVSQSQVVRIIDAVRNRVLDWALALEKRGILGDGLSFSPDDVVRAAAVNYNFTNNQTIQ